MNELTKQRSATGRQSERKMTMRPSRLPSKLGPSRVKRRRVRWAVAEVRPTPRCFGKRGC